MLLVKNYIILFTDVNLFERSDKKTRQEKSVAERKTISKDSLI